METVCLFIFISYLWGTYVRKQLRIILLILENIDISTKLRISIKMSFEMLSLFEYVVIEVKIIYIFTWHIINTEFLFY